MAGEGSAAGGSNQASRNPNLWQQPGPTRQVSPWDQASCSPPGAEPWGAMRPPCPPRGQGPPPPKTLQGLRSLRPTGGGGGSGCGEVTGMGAGLGGGPKNLGQKDHKPRTPSSPRTWVEPFDFSTFPLFSLGEWKGLGEVTESLAGRDGQAGRVPGRAAAPPCRAHACSAAACASEQWLSTRWAPGQGCPGARMLPPRGKRQPARSAAPRGPDSRLGPLAPRGTPCLPTHPPPLLVTLPRVGAAVAWPPPRLPFWSQIPAQRKRVPEEGKVGSPGPPREGALPAAPPVNAPAPVNRGQLPTSTSGPGLASLSQAGRARPGASGVLPVLVCGWPQQETANIVH